MADSINGLGSGLDTNKIIEGLMAIKRRTITNLETAKEEEEIKKNAWTSLSTNVLSLQTSSYSLSRTSTFEAKKALVSDEKVLSATVTNSAIPGTYSFYVNQLATAHQLTTSGINDIDKTEVGNGTVTIEIGGGDVVPKTELRDLNGETGVQLGSIKITDNKDAVAIIDLSNVFYVEDVLDKINSANGINLTATLNATKDGINISHADGDKIKTIEEMSGGNTAHDLGIFGDNYNDTNITGSNVYYLSTDDSLMALNDGLGIDLGKFKINNTEIDLSTAKTINDVITEINKVSGVTASLSDKSTVGGGKGLHLDGVTSVVEVGAGTTAADLGIKGMTTTGDGKQVFAGMNTVLLSNLSGAAAEGIRGTGFKIGYGAGADEAAISITGDIILAEVLDTINALSGTTKVAARYNASGNGLELYATDGTTKFNVIENGSTTAADLGIVRADKSSTVLKGADLDHKYIGENTLLSDLNQGSGVSKGKIKITNKAEIGFEVDLSATSIDTMGEVIAAINAASTTAGAGITASINATGDGLLITDASGGTAANLTIAEVGSGKTAKDLGILGSSTGVKLDGSFETTLYFGTVSGVTTTTTTTTTNSITNTADTPIKSNLADITNVNTLNGGTGATVPFSNIRLDASGGRDKTIDLTATNNVSEAITAINTQTAPANQDFRASFNATRDGLNIIADRSKDSNVLVNRVIESGGSTADHLGILDTSGSSYRGADGAMHSGDPLVNYGEVTYHLYDNYSLDSLNDGLGVDKGKININSTEINLSGATNINDVITAINSSGAGVTAAISEYYNSGTNTYTFGGGKALTLTGSGNVTVAEVGSGTTAYDLGLLSLNSKDISSPKEGDNILGGIDTVLMKNLSGVNGTGVAEGKFKIYYNGTNSGDVEIDISGANAVDTLGQLIDKINAETIKRSETNRSNDTHVAARYNSAGDGIELYSADGSTQFYLENTGGTTLLSDLGITRGSFSSADLTGGDIDLKYISRNTLLSALNLHDSDLDQSGVSSGSIKITNKVGNDFTVDLTGKTDIGDVIDAINTATGNTVTARVNNTGNGLLITDNTGGGSNLTIEEVGDGRTALDLAIAASVTGSEINGNFENAVTGDVTTTTTTTTTATKEYPNYTLEETRDLINDLDIGVQASIINDGSEYDAYRLILTSDSSGERGRIIFDTDVNALAMSVATQAQDALLIMGEPTEEDAVFVTSSTNSVTGFIPGTTLNLKDTSPSQIKVTISNDTDSVVDLAKDFVEKYNATHKFIADQLKYDLNKGAGGPLFADPSLMLLQQQLYGLVTQNISQLSGDIKAFSQVGIAMGLDGSLSLNESTLKSVLQSELDSVKEFFTYNFNLATTATASASNTNSGWTVGGAKDGNTSQNDFANKTTGWQAANGSSYELDFGTAAKEFTSLKIIGTDADILKSFDLQYWDTKNNAWKTYRSVTNTKKDINISFANGLSTTKFKLDNIQGTTNPSIVEIETYQTIGMAGAMDLALTKMTEASSGSIFTSIDGVDETIEDINGEIGSLKERLAIEEKRLRKQFTQLEVMMGEAKTMSDWLTKQIQTLNVNWGYNKK